MSDFLFYLLQFFKTLLSFWWFWLAILLYPIAKYFYIWSIRELKYWQKIDWIYLEIKLPTEVTKSPKAMEDVFNAAWPIYDPPANMRDYWIKGQWTEYHSFEIVGKKGEIRFYIKTPKKRRVVIENALYAEYPDIEIKETEDYSKKFGELPNDEYDMWGCDFKLTKPDIYPIRTYEFWETEITRPEKKLDPLSALFEFMTTGLKEGEECWIQIKTSPTLDEIFPYIKASKKEIDRLMKRAEERTPGVTEYLYLSKAPLDIVDILVEGKPPPERGIKEAPAGVDVGLMKLSPGETEILRSIEQNLGKFVYETNIRLIYVARKDVYSPPGVIGALIGYFINFSTINLNGFGVDKSKSKVAPWFFEQRRLFAKKRKLYRYFTDRRWPWHRKPYIFSTAELATIFHFPAKVVAPSVGVPRVEVKKGGAPPELPVE